MPRNETSRRWSTSLKVSLGVLQWQSTSLEEVTTEPAEGTLTRQVFRARVQALMQQALREGFPREELEHTLRQLTSGGPHVDA
jgi:hypothetical protein